MLLASGYKQAGLSRNPVNNNEEPLRLELAEGRRLKLGDTQPYTQQSLNNLIELYTAWNKPEKSEQWRAKLPQTEAVEQ